MRPRHRSKLVLLSASLLAAAGCSRASDEPSGRAATEAAETVSSTAPREAAADAANTAAPPDIGQAVAPGVAFAYRYAFTLPVEAIAGVQQHHAAACERLGPARCQVTGMSYDQPGQDTVSARLDLMLAPEAAHRFGSEAIAAVEKADGSVDTASLEGDNAGGAITGSQRRSTALRAQLSRIEQRLAIPGLGKEEKAELARRASELRQQLGNEQDLRQQKEASLATTPMTLAYSSAGLFASSNPFGQAAASSLGSMEAMFAFLLAAAGLLLPWLLLVALVVLLVRFRTLKQRLAQLSAPSPAADPVAPPQ